MMLNIYISLVVVCYLVINLENKNIQVWQFVHGYIGLAWIKVTMYISYLWDPKKLKVTVVDSVTPVIFKSLWVPCQVAVLLHC